MKYERMVYSFAGYGLMRRNPVANYVLWFFLIGPAGLVNSVAHVTLPFLTATLYFPGLITVALPTAFGTALAWRVLADVRRESRRSPAPALASLPARSMAPAMAATI